MAEKHLRPNEACSFLQSEYNIQRAPATFAKARCVGGDAPKFRRLGRAIYYAETDLRAWAERMLGTAYRTTSEYEHQAAA